MSDPAGVLCACGHEWRNHGDRAVVPCDRGVVAVDWPWYGVRCPCTGWRPVA